MKSASAALCAALVLLGGCGQIQPIDEVLFLMTPHGVAVVKAGASSPTFLAAGGVPSRDWSTVVNARWAEGGSTRVSAFIPATGTRLWTKKQEGTLTTKIVSEDGNLAALGPANEPYYSYGRRRTHLVVAGSTTPTRSYDLKGNLEPEAFSTDGSSVFVLQYFPARAPSSYQVRRLDLATGRVHDVYTPDAHLQEAMRGDARVQAVSPDGRRLYTLYTLRTHHGTHAFIHTLALDEMWAHCIDLPDSFGIGASSTALSTSADGKRLYVANAVSDTIAEIDPQALEVLRTTDLDFGVPQGANAVQSNDSLYLSSGRSLTELELENLTKKRSWTFSGRISGIQADDGSDYIYVGLRKSVVVLDTASGKALKSLDPPGVGRIGRLGRVTPTFNQVPRQFTCAC